MAVNYTQLIKCCCLSNTFIFDFVPCLINHNKKRKPTTLFSLLGLFFDEEWEKRVEEKKDFTITEETMGSESCYNYLQ